mgnify:CR=1 FL=1
MSSNTLLQTVVVAILCAHVSAIVAVWYSPWGANGLLLLNGMLALINNVTPVKVSADAEDKGLDESEHGEKAYDEGVL